MSNTAETFDLEFVQQAEEALLEEQITKAQTQQTQTAEDLKNARLEKIQMARLKSGLSDTVNGVDHLIPTDDVENYAKGWRLSENKKRPTFVSTVYGDEFFKVSTQSKTLVTQFMDADGLIHVDTIDGGQFGRPRGTTNSEFIELYKIANAKLSFDYLEQLTKEITTDATGQAVAKIDACIPTNGPAQRLFKPFEVILHDLVKQNTKHFDVMVGADLRKMLSLSSRIVDVEKEALNQYFEFSDNALNKPNALPNDADYADNMRKTLNTSRLKYKNPLTALNDEPLTAEDEKEVSDVFSVYFNEQDAKYFANFIGAALMNKNQDEIKRFLIVQGQPNTGKSTAINAFFSALFEDFAEKRSGFARLFSTSNDHATSSFKNTRVAWFDEMEFQDPKLHNKTQDFTGLDVEALKDLITSGTIHVNVKFGDISTQKFTSLLLGVTNHRPLIKNNAADVNGLGRRILLLTIKDTTGAEKADRLKMSEIEFFDYLKNEALKFAKYCVKVYLDDPELLKNAPVYGQELPDLPQELEDIVEQLRDNGTDVSSFEQRLKSAFAGTSQDHLMFLMNESSVFLSLSANVVSLPKPDDIKALKQITADFEQTRTQKSVAGVKLTQRGVIIPLSKKAGVVK